jgi:hypothetical protein
LGLSGAISRNEKEFGSEDDTGNEQNGGRKDGVTSKSHG